MIELINNIGYGVLLQPVQKASGCSIPILIAVSCTVWEGRGLACWAINTVSIGGHALYEPTRGVVEGLLDNVRHCMDQYAYTVLWLLSQPFGIENNAVTNDIFRKLGRLKRQRDIVGNVSSVSEALDKYWTSLLREC